MRTLSAVLTFCENTSQRSARPPQKGFAQEGAREKERQDGQERMAAEEKRHDGRIRREQKREKEDEAGKIEQMKTEEEKEKAAWEYEERQAAEEVRKSAGAKLLEQEQRDAARERTEEASQDKNKLRNNMIDPVPLRSGNTRKHVLANIRHVPIPFRKSSWGHWC